MPENKRVLHFSIGSSKHLVRVMKGLTEIKADMDANSTPSSLEVSIYGSKGKVREVSKKVRQLVEETRNE